MSATAVRVDVEIRSGEGYKIAEVNSPKRIVTCVAMPYERPALVSYRGGAVTEIVSEGAFSGIEKRNGRIRANRDHSWDKICGKVIGSHPSRKEGLVTEVFMFRTDLGDETLTLCEEGGLDASAGFSLLCRDDGRVWEDAEVWERHRSVRRLNRLWLDHLALVPDPAYMDAVVTDVRSGQERTQDPPDGLGAAGSTPNLDRIAHDALRAQFDELDQRWPH